MEYPSGPSIVESISFLDKDDINGPGQCIFPRKTGDVSIDFAFYKISQFSQSSEKSDRIKFAKELDDLLVMLGPNNFSPLLSSLDKLVT